MYRSRVQVFDHGITIISNVDLQPHKYFDETDSNTLELYLFEGRNKPLLYSPADKRLIISRDKVGGHLLRQLLGYLCGHHSEKYDAVHGSGIVVDDAGILLCGNHGTGKSTISNMFSNSTLMDDDLLIIDDSKMHVCGKHGSISVQEGEKKSLLYLTEDGAIKEHFIDAVFLLNSDKDGGFLKQVDNIIPRRYSVLDALNTDLQTAYLQLDPIQVKAPVYQIGTRNNPELTKKSIGSVFKSL